MVGIALSRARAATAVATLAAATLFAQVTAATPAAAAVPGLQTVSAVTVSDSSSPKQVIAYCPAGKRAIGTGFYIDGDAAQVVLDDLVPSSTYVWATAYEDEDGTTGNWWLRVFAVCADPLPGLEVITATTVSSSVAKSAVANCSAGKYLLGSGAAATGGTGQVVIDAMVPGSTSVTSTAYEDANGLATNWTISSYAICAAPLPGLQVVSATTASGLTGSMMATTTCPSGTAPLSAGWDINTRYPGTIFPVVAMPTLQNGGSAVAKINYLAGIAYWSLTGKTVCATP